MLKILPNTIIDRAPEPVLQMLIEAVINRGPPIRRRRRLLLRFARLARRFPLALLGQLALLFLEPPRLSLFLLFPPPLVPTYVVARQNFAHVSTLIENAMSLPRGRRGVEQIRGSRVAARFIR